MCNRFIKIFLIKIFLHYNFIVFLNFIFFVFNFNDKVIIQGSLPKENLDKRSILSDEHVYLTEKRRLLF